MNAHCHDKDSNKQNQPYESSFPVNIFPHLPPVAGELRRLCNDNSLRLQLSVASTAFCATTYQIARGNIGGISTIALAYPDNVFVRHWVFHRCKYKQVVKHLQPKIRVLGFFLRITVSFGFPRYPIVLGGVIHILTSYIPAPYFFRLFRSSCETGDKEHIR